MEISKKSWMYRVAYCDEAGKPEKTNLCNFFWRTVFNLFVYYFMFPFAFILISPLFLVLFLVFLVVEFLVGYRPTLERGLTKWTLDEMVAYKLPTVQGRRILPIYLVLVFGVGWVIGKFVLYYPIYSAIILLICVFLGLIGLVVYKLSKSEFVGLVKEYVLAKKQKICPIIHFTD